MKMKFGSFFKDNNSRFLSFTKPENSNGDERYEIIPCLIASDFKRRQIIEIRLLQFISPMFLAENVVS